MNRLLVVTAFFPPVAAAGTQRAARLVRGIREHGWGVDVLTIPAGCAMRLDRSMCNEIPSDVAVHRVPCRSLWHHSQRWQQTRPGLRRMVARVHRALAKATEPLVPADNLYPWAISATRRGVAVVQDQGIDVIWATSPTISTLLLARRIAKRTGIPYVVDFRDVQESADPATLARRDRQHLDIEREVLRGAAGITYVAEGQIGTLQSKHDCVNGLPQRLIYNWFEADEIAGVSPTRFDRPTILHGGSLYGGRRILRGFFVGLKRCAEERPSAAPCFLQLGPDADARQLKQQAIEEGVADLVRTGASLARFEFLAACLAADILLLAVGRDAGTTQHSEAIPGKLYDYFAAQRPILVVGPPGCAAARMVTRLNRGMAVADDVPEEAARAIEALLAGRGENGPLDLSLEAVAEFESAYVVRRLAEFLRDVTDGTAAERVPTADRSSAHGS